MCFAFCIDQLTLFFLIKIPGFYITALSLISANAREENRDTFII